MFCYNCQVDIHKLPTSGGLSPGWNCLLILLIGLLGGWLAMRASIWFGYEYVRYLHALTEQQLPWLVQHDFWYGILLNWIVLALAYGSLYLLMRWQVRQSTAHYRIRLRQSGLLEQMLAGKADYDLPRRIIKWQPWVIRSELRKFPEPSGDQYIDASQIGFFLDLHLEGGRNHRLYLRPAPILL